MTLVESSTTTTNTHVTLSGLENNAEYTFTITAVSPCGAVSQPQTITATPRYFTYPTVVTQPQHQILIADWRTQEWVELNELTGRHLSVNLSDPSQVTFGMSGDSPEALLLHEGISDIKWIREGIPVFWGRLTNVGDSIHPTAYDISCTAKDYRGLLENREIVQDTPGFKGAPLQYDSTWQVEDIIWDLINHTQTQTAGDLGIRKGIFPNTGLKVADSGSLDLVEFKTAAKIWECIKQILSLDPSVEINIDAVSKKLNVYYPQRGADRGLSLDYGGLISDVDRSVDLPGQFGNYVRTYSEGDLLVDTQIVFDLINRPEGRWDSSFTQPNLNTVASQKRAGQYNFNFASKILPAATMTFAPGQWHAIGGPDGCWAGDRVTTVIKRGRLDVNEYTRIYSLDLSLDQSNSETVAATVGLPKIDPFKSLTNNLRRLNFQ